MSIAMAVVATGVLVGQGIVDRRDVASIAQPVPVPMGWRLFESANFEFAFAYPPDWKVSLHTESVTITPPVNIPAAGGFGPSYRLSISMVDSDSAPRGHGAIGGRSYAEARGQYRIDWGVNRWNERVELRAGGWSNWPDARVPLGQTVDTIIRSLRRRFVPPPQETGRRGTALDGSGQGDVQINAPGGGHRVFANFEAKAGRTIDLIRVEPVNLDPEVSFTRAGISTAPRLITPTCEPWPPGPTIPTKPVEGFRIREGMSFRLAIGLRSSTVAHPGADPQLANDQFFGSGVRIIYRLEGSVFYQDLRWRWMIWQNPKLFTECSGGARAD